MREQSHRPPGEQSFALAEGSAADEVLGQNIVSELEHAVAMVSGFGTAWVRLMRVMMLDRRAYILVKLVNWIVARYQGI